MNLFHQHINKIVVQDFLIKNQTKNLTFLPKLKKVSLSAKFGKTYKGSASTLFELLSHNKSYIAQSRFNILSLNLRKGDPVGVKLSLRKTNMYKFLIIFIFEILPCIKEFDGLQIKSNQIHFNQINCDILLDRLLVFDQINLFSKYLKDLKNFTIVIQGENVNINFFLGCRFPIKIK